MEFSKHFAFLKKKKLQINLKFWSIEVLLPLKLNMKEYVKKQNVVNF